METEKINKMLNAVETIRRGVCKRIDVDDDIKVYACKDVIRIDIKCKGVLDV